MRDAERVLRDVADVVGVAPALATVMTSLRRLSAGMILGKRMMFLTDNVYRMTGETSLDFRKARLSYLDRRQSDEVRIAEKTTMLQELGKRTSNNDVLV